MRDHYDFGSMKGRKNPYTKYLKQPITIRLDRDTVTKYLKQPITIRLDRDTVDYFKSLATEMGIPYQTIINLYLRDCVANQRKLEMNWVA